MADDWQDELLGAWSTPAGDGLSFEATEATPPAWRLVLPESPARAHMALDAQSQALERNRQALEIAEQRLLELTQRLAGGAGVSFAALDGPEATLLRAAATIQAVSRGSSAPATVAGLSFSPLDPDEVAEQSEAGNQWQRWLAQVQEMVSSYARIETLQGSIRVGVTRVGWTGDFETAWQTDCAPDSLSLHRQNVHTALASRMAIVRLASVVAAGAVDIAIKLLTPGMQIFLLPAVWRFIRDTVQQIRAARA